MQKNLAPSTISILHDVATKVVPAGGKVWLYGSRARGDAHENSDWDLLILLPQDRITTHDEDAIGYPFVEAGWDIDADVSPQIYTFAEWEQRETTPFRLNVERDKIPVYESE